MLETLRRWIIALCMAVLRWVDAEGRHVVPREEMTCVEEQRDALHVALGAVVPLPDEVLAMLPAARDAVAYAESVGHSGRHKHAIAYRVLGKKHPGASNRDVSLAVVVAHRRAS